MSDKSRNDAQSSCQLDGTQSRGNNVGFAPVPDSCWTQLIHSLPLSLMSWANRASSTLAYPSTITLQPLNLDSPDSQLDAMPALDATLAAAHAAHFYQHSTLLNAATFKRTLTISSQTLDYGNAPRTRADSPRRTSSRPSPRLLTAAILGQRTHPNGSLRHSQRLPILFDTAGAIHKFTQSLPTTHMLQPPQWTHIPLSNTEDLTQAGGVESLAGKLDLILSMGIYHSAFSAPSPTQQKLQRSLPQSSPHQS